MIRITKLIILPVCLLLCNISVSFADNHAPEAPVGLKATSSESSITISWDENSENDLEGYNIYGKGKGTYGFLKLNGAIIRDNTYVDYSVKFGETYVYYVEALDDSGNISQESVEIEASLTKKTAFKDVSSNAWYKQSIDKLVADNIIAGYADGNFKPNNPVTRAEFAKMLVQTMKYEAVTQMAVIYTDVAGTHWAYPYINIAGNVGSLRGYKDGSFKPTQNITREEAAKAIALSGDLPAGKTQMKDVSSSWAREYIASCVSKGIINGYPDNVFRPKYPVTRAEVAAMLYRLSNN